MMKSIQLHINKDKPEQFQEPQLYINVLNSVGDTLKVSLKAKSVPVNWPDNDVTVKRTDAIIFNGSLSEFRNFLDKLYDSYREIEIIQDTTKGKNWSI